MSEVSKIIFQSCVCSWPIRNCEPFSWQCVVCGGRIHCPNPNCKDGKIGDGAGCCICGGARLEPKPGSPPAQPSGEPRKRMMQSPMGGEIHEESPDCRGLCSPVAAEPPARVEPEFEHQELYDLLAKLEREAAAGDCMASLKTKSDVVRYLYRQLHEPQASPVEGEPIAKLKNLLSFIEQEIKFHQENQGHAPDGTFADGFLAALRQVRDYGIPFVQEAAPSGEPRAKCPRGTAQQWRLSGKYYEADYETRFWTDERVEVFLESFFPPSHVGQPERVAELPNNEELSKAITSRLMGRFTFFWGAVDSLTKKFGPFSDDVAAEIRAALASLRGVQEKRG